MDGEGEKMKHREEAKREGMLDERMKERSVKGMMRFTMSAPPKKNSYSGKGRFSR